MIMNRDEDMAFGVWGTSIARQFEEASLYKMDHAIIHLIHIFQTAVPVVSSSRIKLSKHAIQTPSSRIPFTTANFPSHLTS